MWHLSRVRSLRVQKGFFALSGSALSLRPFATLFGDDVDDVPTTPGSPADLAWMRRFRGLWEKTDPEQPTVPRASTVSGFRSAAVKTPSTESTFVLQPTGAPRGTLATAEGILILTPAMWKVIRTINDELKVVPSVEETTATVVTKKIHDSTTRSVRSLEVERGEDVDIVLRRAERIGEKAARAVPRMDEQLFDQSPVACRTQVTIKAISCERCGEPAGRDAFHYIYCESVAGLDTTPRVRPTVSRLGGRYKRERVRFLTSMMYHSG